MEISRVSQTVPTRTVIQNVKSNASDKQESQKKAEQREEYTPSQNKEKPKYTTYSNLNEKDRNHLIAELKKESEQHYESMRRLVEKLILKQGYTFDQFLEGEVNLNTIEVDEQTRIEAAAAVADDGPLGAEATSERIVKFAIAISGGDINKLEKLKGAIDAGFKQVENILGELPEVSKRTYDLITEKLDLWKEEVIARSDENGTKNRGQQIAEERRNN